MIPWLILDSTIKTTSNTIDSHIEIDLLSMSVTLALPIIFFAAGFIQGVTGFGSALLAIPLLTLFIDIRVAIPLTMLGSLIITIYLFIQLKSHVSRARVLPLCFSAPPGIIIGVTLLKSIPSQQISIAMGGLITTYCLYSLFAQPTPRDLHRGWSYAAGFATGLIGAAFSAGGPPAIIYTTLSNWSKDEIKATLTSFFLFNSCLIITAYAITGLITSQVINLFLLSAPFVLLGTMLGSFYYNRLPRDGYLNIVFLLLGLMGVLMIIMA